MASKIRRLKAKVHFRSWSARPAGNHGLVGASKK